MSNTGIIVFVLVIIGIVWLFCMTKNVQNEKKYKNMNEEEMKICYEYFIGRKKLREKRSKQIEMYGHTDKDFLFEKMCFDMMMAEKVPNNILKKGLDERYSSDDSDIKYLEKKLNLKGKK